jgi:hypothetical protein
MQTTELVEGNPITVDILSTIEADSTQVNADDLTVPRTVTVTGVSKGTAEQPVNIDLAEFPGRAYRPCKSMRRVLVSAWGTDPTTYIGRRMELFNDPTVKWGGAAVGGIRIKALSHIDKPLTISLTESRGKRKPHRIEPLPDGPPAITEDVMADLESRIDNADTIAELDSVATDLKAWDLGSNRKRLQSLWASRRHEIVEAAAIEGTAHE